MDCPKCGALETKRTTGKYFPGDTTGWEAIDWSCGTRHDRNINGEFLKQSDRCRITELECVLRGLMDVYSEVAQVFDGWHCDIAWSDYDTQVRNRMITAIKAAEESKDQA